MRKGEKKVLWVFLYVLIFLAVFALSAVFKITYNPLNEKYSVDWNDAHRSYLWGKGSKHI